LNWGRRSALAADAARPNDASIPGGAANVPDAVSNIAIEITAGIHAVRPLLDESLHIMPSIV
jgi:hypothetical protein